MTDELIIDNSNEFMDAVLDLCNHNWGLPITSTILSKGDGSTIGAVVVVFVEA